MKNGSFSSFERSQRPLKVGLFGGSFDPPHFGHLAVSRFMKQALNLDEVWWLLSPQNPLKKESSDYQERLKNTKEILQYQTFSKVSEIEQQNNLHHTHQTVTFLKEKYPSHRFVWLMGEDSFSSLASWENALTLINTFPLAVYPRRQKLMADRRALLPQGLKKSLAPARRLSTQASSLVFQKAPAWILFSSELMPISSTFLRGQKQQLTGEKNA